MEFTISRSVALLLGAPLVTALAHNSTFVPACIAEQCHGEVFALISDDYSQNVAKCTKDNFGPCASKAWECLGDAPCRAVLECSPKVIDTCKGDVWKMLTQPDEREKIMCLESCFKNGTIDPVCVTLKCGKAAIECLADETCRDAAVCLPKAQLACSKPAFDCIFGTDKTCSENLQCLGHGMSTCAGSALNLLTDSKIADVITCAGKKCPHPSTGPLATQGAKAELPVYDAPSSSAKQLLCIAEKCSSKVLSIFTDQDNKDLLHCAFRADLAHTCSAVWGCLGDSKCNEALSCWAKPFDTCKGDLWKALTVDEERKRLETGVSCLRECESKHKDDFVQAFFCTMDSCSEGILSCYHDATCRDAVQCLPNTASQCVMPQLDAYVHQELFKNSTKCLALGLESCGRGAIEMLRDQDIAEAVQCASQCTPTPPLTAPIGTVVVV